MRLINSLAAFAVVIASAVSLLAQVPTASPVASVQLTQVSAERRQQALLKVLEGQRHLIASYRLRSQSGIASTIQLARDAFLDAVELDPSLAEAYTALAEIAVTAPPNNIDEGIRFAAAAVRADQNSFGGHRLLARLNTLKSGINEGKVEPSAAATAIAEWNEIARLDPRNAEAWAFLASIYERTGRRDEQIAALRKWLASAPPLETQFYQLVLGRAESLNPEAASLKLGHALIKAGKSEEAVIVLSTLVADSPDNAEAVELMRDAVSSAGPRAGETAILALRQAIVANPSNISLINLLTDLYEGAGRSGDAEALLRNSGTGIEKTDPRNSAILLSSLADLHTRGRRLDDAAVLYDKALALLGVRNGEMIQDSDRELAMSMSIKLIRAYQEANKPNEALATIERSRSIFGKSGLFADRQLISFYRSTGKRSEALTVVRNLRAQFPADQSFRRLEASILAEFGRVDEAVAVMRSAVPPKPPTVFDEFSNLLFVSALYADAGRGREAAEAARQAYAVATSDERKQIAQLMLASALQKIGDYAGAESTLRDLLKQTPGNPIALNNLGYFLVERNERLDEAVGLINDALKVDPTNPSYLDSLGWAYFKLGRLDEAEKQLRSALRYDGSSVAIHEHLGDVLMGRGKGVEAKGFWQRALELGSVPDDIARIKGKLR